MENKILKGFIVLVFLAAMIISSGWIKNLSGESKEAVRAVSAVKNSSPSASGAGFENSKAGMYSLKLATFSYAQFY